MCAGTAWGAGKTADQLSRPGTEPKILSLTSSPGDVNTAYPQATLRVMKQFMPLYWKQWPLNSFSCH